MTTITFKTLTWNNCFSFGLNNSIVLDKEPVSQIIAPNGYGKSSIPLILEEALYNKNSKNVTKADIPNRLGNGSYSIQLDFISGNTEYSIFVDRKSNSVKVELYADGEDISSHTAPNTFKHIQEIMGMDFKTTQQLMYQSALSSLEFLMATDTARKKFLVDLFDLSEYVAQFEKFKAAVSSANTQISSLESKVDTLTGWINKNSSIDLEKKELVQKPERPDFSEQIVDLNTKIKNITATNSAILSNEQKKKKLETFVIDASLITTSPVAWEDIYKHTGTLTADKTAAELVLKKLAGLDDKCPTCLQDINKDFYNKLVDENTKIVEISNKELDRINKEVAAIKKQNLLIQKAKEDKAEYDRLKDSIDYSLGSDILNANDLENELSDLKNRLTSIDAEIAKIDKLNASIIASNSKIDTYLEQIDQFTTQLNDTKEILKDQLVKVKKLEVLKKAFSTNGLIAYKLENLVKDLETYTNAYLAELSDGRFTIEFSLTNDKLNVLLNDEGKEVSMKSPSSGELARINISTLLAIRKLMASISKNTINVLFLDEVISVLDDLGKERLVEVLAGEEGLNTFLVSHGWAHPLASKITISKTDGISRIE